MATFTDNMVIPVIFNVEYDGGIITSPLVGTATVFGKVVAEVTWAYGISSKSAVVAELKKQVKNWEG